MAPRPVHPYKYRSCYQLMPYRRSARNQRKQISMLIKTAQISDCGHYRYELRRIWNDALPPMLLVMLNPSKADAEEDDPTITRVMRRARDANCGSIIIVNLGAGRNTVPQMWMAMPDPIGSKNDVSIRVALGEVLAKKGIAVVGWGARGGFMNRDRAFLRMAKESAVPLYCLGKTKRGHPRHPLYVSYETQLTPY